MTAASDNLFPKVILEEVANDGSATVTPTADHRAVFLGEDGLLHAKDSAGAVTNPYSSSGGAGTELDYVQFTSDVTLTGTNEAGADTIVTGTSQSYAAVPIMVEFFSPDVGVGSTGGGVIILLYDGGTILGRLAVEILAAGQRIPIRVSYRLTPTAATHQYIVKAYGPATGTPFVSGGAGGTGTSLPGFIRVTLV